MKKVLLFTVLFCYFQNGFAQSKTDSIRAFARGIVDTLTSPYFFGRGYLKDGMEKAAFFVAGKFHSFGLMPLDGQQDYFQLFAFPVNTINALKVSCFDQDGDSKVLKTGADFIPSAGLPTVQDTFSVLFADSSTLESRTGFEALKAKVNRREMIVLTPIGIKDSSGLQEIKVIEQNALGAGGLIELEKKLTWTVSQTQDSIVRLYALQGKISRQAKSISIRSKTVLDSAFEAANIIGMVKGKTAPDSFLIFSAHYDHLGGIGDSVYFPGANDNASGIAMLLALARYYAQPDHQPKYSMVFIAFAAEEPGLLGSYFFIDHPELNMNKIKFLINMDMVGYGKDGITVVNATVFPKKFQQLRQLNRRFGLLKDIKKRGPAANSDHYFFYKAGVPCFFIYTLGGTAYHDIYDTSKVVTLSKFPDLFQLLIQFVNQF